jgi:hypothetical protein
MAEERRRTLRDGEEDDLGVDVVEEDGGSVKRRVYRWGVLKVPTRKS